MPREKFQTLTEQMFYILLCLRQECCGINMLEQIPAMTGGRVHVGSGTLYNLLEQFVSAGFIRETKVEGRRRSYLLTERGDEILRQEYERLRAQVRDYERGLDFTPGRAVNAGASEAGKNASWKPCRES